MTSQIKNFVFNPKPVRNISSLFNERDYVCGIRFLVSVIFVPLPRTSP